MPNEALSEILGATSLEKFLAEYWGKTILHISGASARFEHLLGWNDLNRVLETYRIDPPRLRLFQNGKSLDPGLYSTPGKKTWPAKLNDGPFMARLQQGATLVLDSIHELIPPIRDLSESLARTLKSNVVVNLYASWRRDNGFDLHWDDQDVIILQITGRKHWKVYKPTRINPLKDDSLVPSPPSQDEPPVWDQVLNAGDMLYLPRGWWHVVTPINEPSMHLTVTIVPPNGADFVKWLRQDMLLDEKIRGNVPRLTGDSDLGHYFEQLRQALTESLTIETFQRFLRSWDANNSLPARIRLPTHSSEPPSLTQTSHIRLSGYRNLALTEGDAPGTVSLNTNGRTWKGSSTLSPALNALSGEQSQSLGDLCKLLSGDAVIREFKMLMMAMAMEGIVLIEAKD